MAQPREVIYQPHTDVDNLPWLYQQDGHITYCTSWMYDVAVADGVPVIQLTAKEYPFARKAAGLHALINRG